MSFFRRFFSANKHIEQKTETALKEILPHEVQVTEDEEDECVRVGLTRTITDEEREIVSLIASAIMAGDRPFSQFRIKSVIGIDEDKEAAVVIAAAIAAKDYPNAAFKLISVEEVIKTNDDKEVSYA
ncbi:hypothetical protein [Lutispora thermophila]|uniref:Uncharacterized protein n=1 Tax=Lutispora thermophila DSM 19022 TaxID=1122184 RepID=A0A1M6IDN0_9FIRM|nr:hypothetical protein [Lutispora thermophila]SHJ32578.1 hypothetical protein SAMN02745176_03210 [Lutispora thermophila DSM 19022]